jgi:hypothetical protein
MRGLAFWFFGFLFVPSVVSLGGLKMIESKASLSRSNGARYELERVANRRDCPTEMSRVARRFGEFIPVSRPSPQVHMFSSLLDVDNVLGCDCGKRSGRGNSSGRSHFRTEKTATCSDITSERIFRREYRVAQFAIGLNGQVLWRGVTAILPNGPKPPIILARLGNIFFPIGEDSVRKNERSFIGNEGLPGQVGLLGSCAPKGSGEGCYDGSKGGDSPIVLVNEVTGTLDVPGKESGWVFFGGIAAVLIALLGYAGFEGWREGAFKHYQRHNDDQNCDNNP